MRAPHEAPLQPGVVRAIFIVRGLSIDRFALQPHEFNIFIGACVAILRIFYQVAHERAFAAERNDKYRGRVLRDIAPVNAAIDVAIRAHAFLRRRERRARIMRYCAIAEQKSPIAGCCRHCRGPQFEPKIFARANRLDRERIVFARSGAAPRLHNANCAECRRRAYDIIAPRECWPERRE
ncbi:MAG: hypothetical protein M0R66_09680 [Candidatus Omnitrophica bacterium]|nr:hypothetical protein [Candidatus Omnitrophota bacterium]